MDLATVLGLAAAALALSAALLSLAYITFLKLRFRTRDLERGAHNAKVADVADPAKSAVRRFEWSEIESLTDNFSPDAVIGEGGFSTVYLGRLPALAAFKVHRPSERLHRAFRRELAVLRCLRHPHVVRLLGYSDAQGEEGALALEYAPNGTLHAALHGGAAAVPLPWARRMSVALRIAGAVEYLHEDCDPQVVHGDITASNVLLDCRLDPKLCDFGSARAGFSAAVRAEPGPTMVGSPGYVDPHYLRTGMVSKKSDIYSFGVLLLELVTGEEAFCSAAERPLTAALAAGEVTVDARVEGECGTGEAAAVVELAARCVGEQPSLRPSMSEVVRMMRERVPSVSSISTAVDDGSFNLGKDS